MGTLLGIGTFPWDPAYETCLGGNVPLTLKYLTILCWSILFLLPLARISVPKTQSQTCNFKTFWFSAGLWMNAFFFGAGQKTLSHEAGHNLGLWHSFHGVSEV